MAKLFYRFRSIENLIGDDQELETQNIYFAHPKQLNDPMEGYRDVYWQGDFIVWKNLFRHYLLCLERFCSLLTIVGETQPLTEIEIPVFLSESDFPTTNYKALFSEIVSTFFSNPNIIALIKGISERSSPVRREELFFYLRAIHQIAMGAIYKIHHSNGLATYKENIDTRANQFLSEILQLNWFEVLERSVKEKKHLDEVLSAIFAVHKQTSAQLDIINRCNQDNVSDYKNRNFVISDFPENYISKLEQLIYPEWYVACFMSDFSNSSVWGHYGKNHSGVCLIFKADAVGESFNLNLQTMTGGSWNKTHGFTPSHGFISHKFEQVDYVKGFGDIDFFRYLGRLSITQLNASWYFDEGNRSICADDMLSDEEAWRARYWSNFHRDILIKSDDWKYEKEYRLILTSNLSSFSDKKDRLLQYDFHSLEGLIFGIKTSLEDKIKIVKIIERKCKELGRKDFKLYQARYSPKDKCIVSDEMKLIKFD